MEMYTMSEDTLEMFLKAQKDQKIQEVKDIVDIGGGAAKAKKASSYSCAVTFKTHLPPFSYTTLITDDDKDLLEDEDDDWTYHLTPIKGMKGVDGSETSIWLAVSEHYDADGDLSTP